MKLLFIGDVVGKSGCDFLAANIFKIKKEKGIDITVVNGENSAQGNGMTKQSAEFLLANGADVITTGNHSFKRRESVSIYEENDVVLRPSNYPEGVIGKGVTTLDMGRFSVAIINLMGVVYMEPIGNPFDEADRLLKEIDTPNIFVDFHAEATAEKKCMGQYLKGRVTAVMGTHTHVQTADETIIDGHTAYITDVGMTGPENSVLGVKNELAVDKMRLHYPVRFEESEETPFLNGVVIDFDEKTGKARSIERLIVR